VPIVQKSGTAIPSGPAYSGSIRRAAFLVSPHAGGTFSVYTNLRTALKKLAVPGGGGITLEWLGASAHPETVTKDPQFAAEMPHGRLVDTRGKSDPAAVGALLAAIEAAAYDLVFVNVLTSPTEMSVAPYLASNIRRVMIVHSITPGTFSAARAVAPYVHAAVGVSPRIQNEMDGSLPSSLIFSAPNALDLSPYENLNRSPPSETFRIIYLGRIYDVDKGVMWLPKIMRRLAGLPVHLTIAGDGPDLPALKQRFAPMAAQVTFLGRIPATSVPTLMANHDALIMPSRFEGLPYTLMEAMAAGCVPVASKIRGSTDFVIDRDNAGEGGEGGLLFPVGDTAAAAAHLRRLATDPQLCQKLRAAGKQNVQERFSIEALTRYYLPVLEAVEKPRAVPQLPRDDIRMLRMGGQWRRLIPRRVKNYLRARLLR
jgi:glycosyltransferase involved in cell wall biosynthesis